MRFLNFHYVKRYRMEIDLVHWQAPALHLPPHFRLVPWHYSLTLEHARAKYHSFSDSMDAQVFPCLSELEGCQRLMSEIKAKEGFVPEATWLLEFGPPRVAAEYCGTIQAVRTQRTKASIQNIGVIPQFRGRGLGTALILASLLGMQQVGLKVGSLEVTAENQRALDLYRRLGFRTVRTLYKTVELATCGAGR